MFNVISLVFAAQLALAHPGHDHGPGSVPLQKGGVMRSLETVNLELTYRDKEIRIYPFSTEMDAATPGKLKPKDPASYSVSATVELPKSKAQPLPLKTGAEYWSAPFDAKSAHRFTVSLVIKQGGHEDKIKWTVEPKK